MRRRGAVWGRWWFVAGAISAVLVTVGGPMRALAEDPADRASRAAAKRSGDGSADSKKEEAQIEAKLDQVLANQDAILKKFDAVMEELRIIKVRATIRAGGSSS